MSNRNAMFAFIITSFYLVSPAASRCGKIMGWEKTLTHISQKPVMIRGRDSSGSRQYGLLLFMDYITIHFCFNLIILVKVKLWVTLYVNFFIDLWASFTPQHSQSEVIALSISVRLT